MFNNKKEKKYLKSRFILPLQQKHNIHMIWQSAEYVYKHFFKFLYGQQNINIYFLQKLLMFFKDFFFLGGEVIKIWNMKLKTILNKSSKDMYKSCCNLQN